jgi:adenylosuccinate lyase
VIPALENVALWHERDISHSSVERVIAPDATIALDFALNRLAGVVAGLVVDEARMQENLARTQGLVFSQRVLLALTDAGLGRQRAYELVQQHALAAWERREPLLQRLESDPEVTRHLAPAALSELFDVGYHTRHVGSIFGRVFEDGGDR